MGDRWVLKKIVFHAGFQKTGSTAVQNRILDNINHLSPYFHYLGKRDLKDLKKFAQQAIRNPSSRGREKLLEALEELASGTASIQQPVVLMSSEILFGNDIYSESGNLVSWMEQILPLFAKAFSDHELECVFYTRDPESWLFSTYRQSVLMRGYTITFDEYRRNLPFALDWDSIRKTVEECVAPSNVTFVDMKTDIGEATGLGTALFRHCQVPETVLSQLSFAASDNVSLNEDALQIMREANVQGLWKTHLTLLGELLKELQSLKPTELSSINPATIQDIQSEFRRIISNRLQIDDGMNAMGQLDPKFDCIVSKARAEGWDEVRLSFLGELFSLLRKFDPDVMGEKTPKIVKHARVSIRMTLQKKLHPELSAVAVGRVGATAPAVISQSQVSGQKIKIAIGTCARDEGPFILEWIAFYKAIGVTDFVIYTNDCSDGTDEILDRLSEMGVVSRYDNPAKSGKHQIVALRKIRDHPEFENADWKLIVDLDEFLNIHVGNGTIPELLQAVNYADVISVNMAMFANGGINDFRDEPITEQFIFRNDYTSWNGKDESPVKSLFRGDLPIGRIGAHRPFVAEKALETIRWVNGSGQQVPDHFKRAEKGKRLRLPSAIAHDFATLNHYALRSLDSFLVKRSRGDVNSPHRLFDESYWSARNEAAVKDQRILRIAGRFREELDKLKCDATLRDLHDTSVDRHRRMAEALRSQPDFESFLNSFRA